MLLWKTSGEEGRRGVFNIFLSLWQMGKGKNSRLPSAPNRVRALACGSGSSPPHIKWGPPLSWGQSGPAGMVARQPGAGDPQLLFLGTVQIRGRRGGGRLLRQQPSISSGKIWKWHSSSLGIARSSMLLPQSFWQFLERRDINGYGNEILNYDLGPFWTILCTIERKLLQNVLQPSTVLKY